MLESNVTLHDSTLLEAHESPLPQDNVVQQVDAEELGGRCGSQSAGWGYDLAVLVASVGTSRPPAPIVLPRGQSPLGLSRSMVNGSVR